MVRMFVGEDLGWWRGLVEGSVGGVCALWAWGLLE